MKDIAIIGLSGKFPGAKNINEFWENLCEGKESISFFSDEQLKKAGVPDELLSNPTYVKAAPVLDGIEFFDAEFFNISKREAELMDPQQRILLECAWEAFETAGYPPTKIDTSVGVFSCSGGSVISYLLECFEADQSIRGTTTSIQHTGTDKDFLSTRISYKLNLKGPSVAVQTACSSSLVAVHMACQSIRNGDCDMALAGGVNIRIPHMTGYLKNDGDVLSADGHCRSFDAAANGTVFGSGAGLVLLKPVQQAMADGDAIFAVIKGSAINNDGNSKVSYSASSVSGQVQCVTKALNNSGVNPETISYLEAHGAGTIVGDPIEISALTLAYRKFTDKKEFCSIGSVKTNIGHLDTAAGIAGLLKTVLCLYHSKIPPLLNFNASNPKINFSNGPFYISKKLQNWMPGSAPRRAGVNSLGIGGTNAHVILEEAPSVPTVLESESVEAKDSKQIFTISAQTDSALSELVQRYIDFLSSNLNSSLPAICENVNHGRVHFKVRLAVTGTSVAEMRDKLICFQKDQSAVGVWYGKVKNQKPVKSLSGKESESVFAPDLDLMAVQYISGLINEGKDFSPKRFHLKRADLPLYPFQRQKYWVSRKENSKDSPVRAELANIYNKNKSNEEIQNEIINFLKSELSKVLNLIEEEIDIDLSLMSLGMDSLMAVEFRNRLQKSLGDERGRDLPATLVFNYSTVSTLTDYLMKIFKSEARNSPNTLLKKEIPPEEAIAIVGMSCRFPGGADTSEKFWNLMDCGLDAVGAIPLQRFDIEEYYDADPATAGKTYVRHGGFLNNIDQFDPYFFGISPKEALALDPQQRLLLELSWEALEKTGEGFEKIFNSKTSVHVGVMYQDYAEQLASSQVSEQIEMHMITGAGLSSLAGRLSYFFNFKGPALSVDTACSSSLTAIHLACQDLKNGTSDRALVGGVNVILSPVGYISMSRARAFSPKGSCSSFDESADGYVRSEGAGVLILKRLSDAQKMGDPILAVIRGSAVNQDGRSISFTAPNGTAQQAVIRDALADAGVSTSEISYVEAHGTGTPLGDPIEFQALSEVFSSNRNRPLYVGSVKTNIGHTEAAAGIAGVIKTILAFQKEKIPAILHFKKLNPNINGAGSKLEIPLQTIPWKKNDITKRMAGISSFGISGTNGHVVLEEAPIRETPAEMASVGKQLLALSAKTKKALNELVSKFIKILDDTNSFSLKDICASANTGRAHFEIRLAIISETKLELKQKLLDYQQGILAPEVWTGHVKKIGISERKLEGITEAKYLKQLEVIPEKGRLLKIAEFYVLGIPINWPAVAGSGFKRVDLPTYPFQRERYWIERSGSKRFTADSHPLLGEHVVSSIDRTEHLFEKEFRLAEQSYLSGHKVFEKVVVPGAAYCEIGMVAARKVFHSNEYNLRNISIVVPLILNRNQSRTVQLAIKKETIGGSFRISSKDSLNSEWTTHVTGEIERSQLTEIATSRLSVIQDRCTNQLEPAKFYERLKYLGFDYTGKYQSIKEIYFNQNEVLAKVELPESTSEQILKANDTYLFHPALLDACLHAGFAIVEEKATNLFMPIGINQFICYRKAQGTLWTNVKFQKNSQLAENQIYKMDVLVFDSLGLLAEVRGLTSREVTRNSFEHTISTNHSNNLEFEVKWKEKELEKGIEVKTGTWLILSDRSGVGARLAEQAEKSSNFVKIIYADLVKDGSEYQRILSHFNQPNYAGPPLTQIVHLFGLDSKIVGGDLSYINESQKLIYGTALELIKSIKLNKQSTVQVTFVTEGAQAVTGDQSETHFLQSALLGLGRVANHEDIKCLLVDLNSHRSSGERDFECSQLYREIISGSPEREIAFRNESRLVPRLTQKSNVPNTVTFGKYSNEASYLITGGLGGVGLQIAEFLVAEGVKYLILVGRNPPKPNVMQKIKKLESQGVHVFVENGDVTKYEDIKRIFSRIGLEKGIPELKGIIHAAGINFVAPIGQQTWLNYEEVLGSKMQGAWLLYKQIERRSIDFFILCSSTASMLGYPGQASYAAANAMMDGFAFYLRKKGIGATSINWGPWSEVGMLGDLNQRQLGLILQAGESTLSPAEGLVPFAKTVFSRKPQIGVMRIQWASYIANLPKNVNHPLFEELEVTVEKSSVKVTKLGERLRNVSSQNHWGVLKNEIIDFLKSEVANVLGIEKQNVNTESNLMSLGMDSLMAVELRNQLKNSLGTDFAKELPAVFVFSYPTISAITDYLMNLDFFKQTTSSISWKKGIHSERFEEEDRAAFAWATAPENSQDPRAVKVLAAMVEKLRGPTSGI